ncbi:hypothetical protein R9X47_22720 [Wukongibacter baidiensis]
MSVLVLIGILCIASIGTWFRFSHNSSVKERIMIILVFDMILTIAFFKYR